jgi:hypothetical protein
MKSLLVFQHDRQEGMGAFVEQWAPFFKDE